MKKLSLILLLSVISLPLKAQLIDGYGLKGGLGIANSTWDFTEIGGEIDWDNDYGISIRGFADFFDFKNFQLEGEVAYSQKGAKKEYNVTDEEHPDGYGDKVVFNNKLDYLSLALMAKIKFELPIFTPYLLAGPQFNYLVSKENELAFEPVYKNYSDNVFGITLGVGTEIKLLVINLVAEYRYERDLKNNYTDSNLDIKNYTHTILVGVKF